jgi:hypothetical protein
VSEKEASDDGCAHAAWAEQEKFLSPIFPGMRIEDTNRCPQFLEFPVYLDPGLHHRDSFYEVSNFTLSAFQKMVRTNLRESELS